MLAHATAYRCYYLIKESKQMAQRRELFNKAVDYGHLRALWMLAPQEQRPKMARRRTLAHNAFIDACNCLSRAMASSDEDNQWRADLGDDRRIIGDFACYLHSFLGIEAR
jgi:hypothetical protein